MVIKLIVTDIDGTIMKYKGGFNQSVIDCIKKLDESGIKVIPVTGRMHKSAKKVADELGLKNPIVSYQGALVKDNTPEENILYERYIPNDLTEKIIKYAKSQKIHINLYMNDDLYVEQENEFTQKYAGHQKIPYNVIQFSDLQIDKVNKVLLIDYNDADKVTFIKKQLQSDFPDLYIVKSTDYFCEICNKEATKGHGVKCIQDYYGISKSETLAIGDHDNDLELLLSGGVAVAMGNATENLKQVATYITDTVDNDGFVKAVEKFVKEGVSV